MSDAPERIWIQSDHIPDNIALDKWNVKPDADEAHLFTGYIRADVAQSMVAAAYKHAAHMMPRYFGVWSSTGVHIGVWDDGATAAKVLGEYPGGVMRDLIDASAILALIEKDKP